MGQAQQVCNGSKFWGVSDTIQKDLDSLGKGAERSLIELSKEKYKVLHLGQNSSMLPYRLWANQLENNMAEKGPECPDGQADHEPAILPHGKKG